MKTTKITLQAEIYDDPEFCTGEYNRDGKCPQLKYTNCLTLCRAFKNEAGRKQALIYDDNGLPLKCDQCKEAWNESNKQTQDKT